VTPSQAATATGRGQETGAPAADPSARGRAAGWLVSALRGYQLVRTGRPSGCRFLPSCSEYAIQAVEAHGAGRGATMAARRLLRCHPFGGHGVDPVPVPDRGAPCSR
jgi:hypothetical protein